MVRYRDPEDEDTSQVHRRDPRKAALRRQKRRERNASLPADQAEREAKEAALTLLDSQARSSGEIVTRLRERGYQPEVIDRVIARLEEVSILDDVAYARMMVRTRFRERGLVGRALVQELQKKKLSPEAIAQATDQVSEDDMTQRAIELARKKYRTLPSGLESRKRAQRVMSYMARRGYGSSQIWHAFSVVDQEAHLEDD